MSAGIDELIERLRNNEIGLRYISANEIMSEAADTIERLQRELDEARKDAERYRYAADNGVILLKSGTIACVGRAEANSKIDAARQPQG